MYRRNALRVIAAAATAVCVGLTPTAGLAQDFPSQPVRILVGFSAGSSTDVATRLVAEAMSESLGQRVIVENRPGAASNVATQAVAVAKPDGYTLLMGTVANTINTALDRSVDFKFPSDFAPVSTVGAVPMILVVHPDVAVESVEKLVDMAKGASEPMLYGSAGVGTAPHLSAELFASSTGIEITHVPYQGSGDAVRDLVDGRINLLFAPQSSALAQIQEGNLRPLASSLKARSGKLPEVPTLDETVVPGFDTSVWFGLFAPSETPKEVLAKLNGAVAAALQSDTVKQGFANSGIEPLGGTAQDLSDYVAREVESWTKVAADAEITVN